MAIRMKASSKEEPGMGLEPTIVQMVGFMKVSSVKA